MSAYSLDLREKIVESVNNNPIEEAFAKIKHILRKIGARTKDALIEAMGRALAAVGVQDAWDTSLTAATAPRRSNYVRRCECPLCKQLSRRIHGCWLALWQT